MPEENNFIEARCKMQTLSDAMLLLHFEPQNTYYPQMALDDIDGVIEALQVAKETILAKKAAS